MERRRFTRPGSNHYRNAFNLLLVVVLIATLFPQNVDAKERPEMIKMRCTCYTSSEGSITASGGTVHEGIVAGKKEWLGYVAIVYDMDMNLIGYFEFTDTGAGIDTDGDGIGDSLKNGTSIDIYRNTLDRCYEWVGQYGDYVYAQIIYAEG